MSIPSFSIKRPITTVMILLALVLVGVISWQRLPQELFPPVTYPQLTISTTYANAAPQEIETLVTKPLEEVIGTVSGLKRISSISREGISLISLEFSWDTNMDFASLNVREKIDLVKEKLPREGEDPIIMKFNPFELPVMILSVTSSRGVPEGPTRGESRGIGTGEGGGGSLEAQEAELLRISKKYIKDGLEKVDGVAYASLTGGVEREILVEVDQGRLYASNVPILEIVNALGRSNLNYPAGSIKGDFYEYLIRTMGEYQKVSDLNEVPVMLDEIKDYPDVLSRQDQDEEGTRNRIIFLSEIAQVKDTYKERTSYSRYNGKSNISVSIFKQSGSTTVAVAENIKAAIKRLKGELPKGVLIKTVYDQSSFIESSLKDVRNAGMQGGVLAFLVLLFFLQSYRNALVVAIPIPTTVLIVFSLMYLRGLSINIISLGGLSLSIGMLVDNAIVIIENIYRHQSEGKDATEAAIKGSEEVTGAIVSSTLTTIAVFIPMIFVVGIAGQIFKPIAFTVTYSQIVSLAVALMTVPLLMSAGRRNKQSKMLNSDLGGLKGVGRLAVSFLNKTESLYAVSLDKFLINKVRNVSIILVIFLASLFIFLVLDKELMPRVDEGQFIVKVDMPAGTLLDVTNQTAEKVEKILMDSKYVEDVTVNVGSAKTEKIGESLTANQAEILVNLAKKRKIRTDDFIGQLKSKVETLKLEANTVEYMVQGSVIQGSFKESAPVMIEVKGEDLKTLSLLAGEVQQEIEGIRGIYGVKNSTADTSPETRVEIVKDRALLYDLSVADIARIVQVALRGYVATTFKEEGEEIDIRVRLRAQDRQDFSKLNRLIINTPLKIDIPLMEVARLVEGKGPTSIRRIGKERTVLISANLTKARLSKVVSEINKRIKGIKLPVGYKIKLGGEEEQMQESFASLRFALIMSIVLIYMIMAAQFESLWQPFIIMFTMPLSMIGVAVTLFLTNTSVNVMVLLGMIILGGIVVNNGIVLIDFINLLTKEQNMPIRKAVVEAGRIRLRPILMTALTSVFGLIPLALGIGEGAALQAPMAITVMGGLLLATFLTLFIIPAIYLIVEERRKVR